MQLAEPQWRVLQAGHEARVDALLAGHRLRARSGTAHPVEDFLFTYYSYRPAQLRRWHPGAGVVLAGAEDRLGWRDYVQRDGGVGVDAPGFLARRGAAMARTAELLRATASRPAQLGCFGLHEWAMVYRSREVRHDLPLRLTAAGTDAVVEQNRLRCTHFDAFRFFTGPARARNDGQPSRELQSRLEQPGCLHATMDLYKWAYKLQPWVSSALVLDCFELARDVRVLDMRAAPYDLTSLGYAPVPIETARGRAEYVAGQRGFAERGADLRARLTRVLDTADARQLPAA